MDYGSLYEKKLITNATSSHISIYTIEEVQYPSTHIQTK